MIDPMTSSGQVTIAADSRNRPLAEICQPRSPDHKSAKPQQTFSSPVEEIAQRRRPGSMVAKGAQV